MPKSWEKHARGAKIGPQLSGDGDWESSNHRTPQYKKEIRMVQNKNPSKRATKKHTNIWECDGGCGVLNGMSNWYG